MSQRRTTITKGESFDRAVWLRLLPRFVNAIQRTHYCQAHKSCTEELSAKAVSKTHHFLTLIVPSCGSAPAQWRRAVPDRRRVCGDKLRASLPTLACADHQSRGRL